MAPYYFPDVVRNADGSLTGYFDYRPKDADEAIIVARSTDNGATWTTEGKALEQNAGYCPTADTNDDGQGHPYVMSGRRQQRRCTRCSARPATTPASACSFTRSTRRRRPAPALPANEPVGVDPNTFADRRSDRARPAAKA